MYLGCIYSTVELGSENYEHKTSFKVKETLAPFLSLLNIIWCSHNFTGVHLWLHQLIGDYLQRETPVSHFKLHENV